jgi:zeaxanthin epoxidase
LQYAIFPAQFAFLYSFYPTGDMGDLPAKLEQVWEAKHFEGAEKVFAEQAGGKEFSSGPSFFENAKADEPVTTE